MLLIVLVLVGYGRQQRDAVPFQAVSRVFQDPG
jgi:hypothetical protein